MVESGNCMVHAVAFSLKRASWQRATWCAVGPELPAVSGVGGRNRIVIGPDCVCVCVWGGGSLGLDLSFCPKM